MTPHVRDCLDYFVRDWKVVKRNHRELHGGQTVPDVSKYPTADVMEEMVFNEETDKLIFSAVKGGDFHLDERLLGDYNMDVKKLNDKDRQINRFPLLGLLPLAKDQLRPSDTRILYSPPVTPRLVFIPSLLPLLVFYSILKRELTLPFPLADRQFMLSARN